MRFRHKEAYHFFYEKVDKPYFGPWQRAINALLKVDKDPFTEEQYLDFIKEKYPRIYDSLECVRFYDFTWQRENKKVPYRGFRFRLAVTYIRPYPEIRDLLFEMREYVTKNTGWYPLVQGSLAKISQPNYIYLRHRHKINNTFVGFDTDIGKLLKIVDVSNNDGVNSLLLEGMNGSILFDTGFGVNMTNIDGIRAVCLSHFHKDHSFGLWEILNDIKGPVVLSETSLTYLISLSGVGLEQKKLLLEKALVIESPKFELKKSESFRCFPVFHAPGSYGFLHKSSNINSVYYLGDICLKNGFYNCFDEIISTIEEDDSENKYVVLDAAMVGKSDFSISDEDEPRKLLEEIASGVNKRNIIFISSSPEMLIYSYILAFSITRESKERAAVKLVLNNNLYYLIKTLWNSVILKSKDNIDPFIFSVIGKSRSNFVESQRVYPMSSLDNISNDENTIIFVTANDLVSNDSLKSRMYKSDVILAGTLAIREDIPVEVTQAKPRSILRVASSDWSFHSDEHELSEFIKRLSCNNIKTVLFHNYPKTLRKFIKKYGLDSSLVSTCSKEGIILE